MSQNALEDRAGLSSGSISRIEAGERQELTSSRLAAVAKVLGTTPGFLLHGAGDRPIIGLPTTRNSYQSGMDEPPDSSDPELMGWFTKFPNLKKALDFDNRWPKYVIAAALLYTDDCPPKEWPRRLDTIADALRPIQPATD